MTSKYVFHRLGGEVVEVDAQPIRDFIDNLSTLNPSEIIVAIDALNAEQTRCAFAELAFAWRTLKSQYDFALTEKGVRAALDIIELARAARVVGVPLWSEVLNDDSKENT